MRIYKFRAWHKNSKHMAYDVTPFQQDANTIVMQYTEHKDRNAKEIYEADIVKDCNDRIAPILGVVEWSNDTVQWLMRYPQVDNENLADCNPESKCEVIGNIYENPELLQQ